MLALCAPAVLGFGQVSDRLPRLRHLTELQDEAPGTRAAAARALRSAEPTGRLLRALRESLETTNDPAAIGEIAATIAWHRDRGATPTLVAVLRSAPPQAVPAIARALAELGTPAGLRALVEALEVPELMDGARVGLLRAGPAALPHLLRAIAAAPTLAAIEVVGAVGDASAVPALVDAGGRGAAPIRIAVVKALGAIGDGRAAGFVRRQLALPEPQLVDAAIEALGRLGRPVDAVALEALLEDAEARRERAVLAALLALDPERARDAIVARVTSSDPVVVRRATEVALATPQPELAAVYHGLLRNGVEAAAAASVLAELEDGAGLPALLAEVERLDEATPSAREALGRALAVLLRRWIDRIPSEAAEAGRRALEQVLGEGRDSTRGITLRALAGSDEAATAAREGLADPDPQRRIASAQALPWNPSPAAAAALEERLAGETDPLVLRALLFAAGDLGVAPAEATRLALLGRSELGAAAMAVLRGPQPDSIRRELRRTLRRGGGPERAAAALALAATDDGAAWRALVERLDRDSDPAVRRASGEALARLAVPGAREALGPRARIEADSVVRRALEAAVAGQRRPRVRGRGVLRFAIRAAGSPQGVGARIVLPTGEVRWVRTLPTGEAFVLGQPSGVADVQVELETDPATSAPSGQGIRFSH